MFFPISPRPPNGMICNLALPKWIEPPIQLSEPAVAGSKKIFLHCMSKIKAVHSRFSYYITWGKEIGKCGGRKYEGGGLGLRGNRFYGCKMSG